MTDAPSATTARLDGFRSSPTARSRASWRGAGSRGQRRVGLRRGAMSSRSRWSRRESSTTCVTADGRIGNRRSLFEDVGRPHSYQPADWVPIQSDGSEGRVEADRRSGPEVRSVEPVGGVLEQEAADRQAAVRACRTGPPRPGGCRGARPSGGRRCAACARARRSTDGIRVGGRHLDRQVRPADAGELGREHEQVGPVRQRRQRPREAEREVEVVVGLARRRRARSPRPRSRAARAGRSRARGRGRRGPRSLPRGGGRPPTSGAASSSRRSDARRARGSRARRRDPSDRRRSLRRR